MRPSFVLVTCCLLGIVCGCAGDPGSMGVSEVETKLEDALSLKSVSLKSRPEGGFAGTGQDAAGTNYIITVDQKETDRSLWYSATSEKGELKAGGFKEFGPSWLRSINQIRIGIKVILILFVLTAGGFAVAMRLARRTKHAEPSDAPKSPVGHEYES